jgi:dolichol-phosphate mannosyltransferase
MPVANEEETIEKLVTEILALPVADLTYMPVLDRFSQDSTKEILDGIAESDPRVKVIFFQESSGVVSCYLYGFEIALEAGADYIFEMDAGGSHDPEDLPKMVAKLDEGYDCVLATRFSAGGGFVNQSLFRRLVSKCSTLFSKIILNIPFTDISSGFNGYQSHVLEELGFEHITSKGHSWHIQLKWPMRKYRYVEVPIIYRGSKSSFKFKYILDGVKTVWALRHSSVP